MERNVSKSRYIADKAEREERERREGNRERGRMDICIYIYEETKFKASLDFRF